MQQQPIQNKQELIGHGAEAKVWKITQGDHVYVVKQRLPKKYRHPKLDTRINTARVKSEAKILAKAHSHKIKVPTVLNTLVEENKIIMEYIEGDKLKNWINDNPTQVQNILDKLATIVKKLHSLNIVHGDLTTSNMIHHSPTQQIFLLDFGLASVSSSIQDKAVDLYLFEKAFIATHPHLQKFFAIFLQKYEDKKILDRLEAVRQRGRKKVAFG